MKRKKGFWNKEYAGAAHLALSDEHSEDLEKFTRFLLREHGKQLLNVTTRFVDIGCGNGRNSAFIAETFGMRGLGYDNSPEAIASARHTAESLSNTDADTQSTTRKVEFLVRDIRDPIPLPEASVTLALDMMASHVLKRVEREALRTEIIRVLRPNGWLFFKTFLRDEDAHAERLLSEFPGPEEGMYIHPEIRKAEYVWREEDIQDFFKPFFTIHKIERSHKHVTKRGGAWKRRTASVYLEKSSSV